MANTKTKKYRPEPAAEGRDVNEKMNPGGGLAEIGYLVFSSVESIAAEWDPYAALCSPVPPVRPAQRLPQGGAYGDPVGVALREACLETPLI